MTAASTPKPNIIISPFQQTTGKPISVAAAARAAKQYALLVESQDSATHDIMRAVGFCYANLSDVNGHAAVPKAVADHPAKKKPVAVELDVSVAPQPAPVRSHRKPHRRDSATIMRVF